MASYEASGGGGGGGELWWWDLKMSQPPRASAPKTTPRPMSVRGSDEAFSTSVPFSGSGVSSTSVGTGVGVGVGVRVGVGVGVSVGVGVGVSVGVAVGVCAKIAGWGSKKKKIKRNPDKKTALHSCRESFAIDTYLFTTLLVVSNINW
ncbi:hypothetical protein HY086_06265 [Candidatus Gottesmanbacteria bacterium]|nr:hypothetical protein [Candidatus Gottesmanbacteria bacterium]